MGRNKKSILYIVDKTKQYAAMVLMVFTHANGIWVAVGGRSYYYK